MGSLEDYYSRMGKKKGNFLDKFITTQKGTSYSFFRRFRSYKGFCCRIQRDSDGSTIDIGFVGNYVDVAAIIDFCAGTVGRLVRMYNQFPNFFTGDIGYLAVKTPTVPIIYNGGIIKLDTLDIISADYNGSQYLSYPINSLSGGDFMILGVGTTDDSSSANDGSMYGLSGGAADFEQIGLRVSGGGVIARVQGRDGLAVNNFLDVSSVSVNTPYIFYGVERQFSGRELTVNGTTSTQSGGGSLSSSSIDAIYLGNYREPNSQPHRGKISETLHIHSDVSSSVANEIATIVNGDYKINFEV